MNQERSIRFTVQPYQGVLNSQYGSKGWELLDFAPHFIAAHPHGFKGTFRVTPQAWDYETRHAAWPDPVLLQTYLTDGWQLVAAVPDATTQVDDRHLLLMKRAVPVR